MRKTSLLTISESDTKQSAAMQSDNDLNHAGRRYISGKCAQGGLDQLSA